MTMITYQYSSTAKHIRVMTDAIGKKYMTGSSTIHQKSIGTTHDTTTEEIYDI